MQISVATKIFAIAVIVIAAMTVVSFVNLASARDVGLGIQRITSGYLQVYDAAAQAHVYSTEQAYRMRQYIAAKALRLGHAGSERDATAKRLNWLDAQVQTSLAAARRITAQELKSHDPLVDKAQLARIDERLLRLETEERDHLPRQLKLLDAMERGDTATFNEGFSDLTKWRAGYDDYIDETRKMVFAAAHDAGQQVVQRQTRVTVFSVALLALAGALAVGMALVLSRQLVAPLKALLAGIREIAAGRLEVQVAVKTKDEVGNLTEAFNDMTEELRVGVRARELFGKYVDPRVARRLIETPQSLGEDGERRTMTVMFCDLQGFTSMSEQMTPRGLVSVMNRHFTLMSEVIRDHHGVIDKFIGDALMAFWGPPFVGEAEQGRLAVSSAISQTACVAQLQSELPDLLSLKQGLPSLQLRIGIASGEVLVGSIGSDLMRNFTVMGDAVNLASRLEGANKLYGSRVLIDEDTAGRLGEDVVLRELDSLVVMGQSTPVRIFEVIGRKDQVTRAQVAARDAFQRGLAAYRAQDWPGARTQFEKALAQAPDDAPAKLFLQRVEALRRKPPRGEWSGVWVMETK